jgi:hypothetical protein
MDSRLTLPAACRAFSRCIRAVGAGAGYVFFRNSRAVVRLCPVSDRRVLTPVLLGALAEFRAVVRGSQWQGGAAADFDRDSLHER